jgi:hypothetical protein
MAFIALCNFRLTCGKMSSDKYLNHAIIYALALSNQTGLEYALIVLSN